MSQQNYSLDNLFILTIYNDISKTIILTDYVRLTYCNTDIIHRLMGLRYMATGNEKPNRDRTKARILRTATKLFAEQGYQKTTIMEISKEAGFSEAALYEYFQGKEDLLHTISRYLGETGHRRTAGTSVRDQGCEQQAQKISVVVSPVH